MQPIALWATCNRNASLTMPSFTVSTQPRRIGFMAELMGAGSLAPMVEAAVKTVESHGFSTLVIASGGRADEELAAWDTLARSHCEGFLVYPDCLSNDQLARLISTRKNVLLANLNDVQVGAIGALHLLGLGHRQIAMVTGPVHRCRVQHRSEGFVQQLQSYQSDNTELQTLEADLTFEGGANAMNLLLTSDFTPTAVFFHSDQMALGALSICQKNRLRVPDDISLMGCGDILAASQARPALSTINQSLAEVGTYTAERLINMINGVVREPTTGSTTELVKPTLAPRFSVLNKHRSASLAEGADNNVISERERECLQWAAMGKTSWEISQILGVTESTIIYHLRNATRKLDAANRLHAVAKALKASIIDF